MRLADYLELTKPRISGLVLFTVLIGAGWGAGRSAPGAAGSHGAGDHAGRCRRRALNQYLERRVDARIRRTEYRPLPAGRLQSWEVLTFGLVLATAGLVDLLAAVPHAGTAFLAALTLLLYVGLYTPLKRVTSLNTLVGAVPGALPPLIGWSAVSRSFDPEAVGLFLIIFVWQIPHFLAIAWIYRDDYARGGFRMLPVVDRHGGLTVRSMVLFCLVLIPASLVPALGGEAGLVYVIGAVLLGLGFLASTLAFVRSPSIPNARRVLRASLLYLPAVLGLLLLLVMIRRL